MAAVTRFSPESFLKGWRRYVGTGAFSNVFNVKSVSNGDIVTLKLYKASSHGDGRDSVWTRELQILNMINNACPTIVHLKGIYMSRSEGRVAGLVFENAELGNWLDFLLKFGPLVRQRGEHLFEIKCFQALCVARALAFLNARHITHGDINLSNVLIFRARLAAKLCDFDAAAAHAEELLSGPADRASVLVHRPYLAPELAAGGADGASYNSDIYAFGVLLYHAFVGDLKVWIACSDGDCAREAEMMEAVRKLTAVFQEVAEEGQQVTDVILGCTKAGPDERSDVNDIEVQLRNLVEGMKERLKKRKEVAKRIVDSELISRSNSMPQGFNRSPSSLGISSPAGNLSSDAFSQGFAMSRSSSFALPQMSGPPITNQNLSVLLPSPGAQSHPFFDFFQNANIGIDRFSSGINVSNSPSDFSSSRRLSTTHKKEDVEQDSLRDPSGKPSVSIIKSVMHFNDIQRKWRTVLLQLGVVQIDIDAVQRRVDCQLQQEGEVDHAAIVHFALELWLEKYYYSATRLKLLKALMAAQCFDSAHDVVNMPDDID